MAFRNSSSDDEMMSDAAPIPASMKEGESSDQPESESDDSGSPITRIPKNMLMGKPFKVGDEIVLKINAIGDDDVEVTCAPGKGGEESYETPQMEGGEGQHDEMAEMMG